MVKYNNGQIVTWSNTNMVTWSRGQIRTWSNINMVKYKHGHSVTWSNINRVTFWNRLYLFLFQILSDNNITNGTLSHSHIVKYKHGQTLTWSHFENTCTFFYFRFYQTITSPTEHCHIVTWSNINMVKH
jgi:hypothetical protein